MVVSRRPTMSSSSRHRLDHQRHAHIDIAGHPRGRRDAFVILRDVVLRSGCALKEIRRLSTDGVSFASCKVCFLVTSRSRAIHVLAATPRRLHDERWTIETSGAVIHSVSACRTDAGREEYRRNEASTSPTRRHRDQYVRCFKRGRIELALT